MQAAAQTRHPAVPGVRVLVIGRSAETSRPYREALADAGHRVIAGPDAVAMLRKAMRQGVDMVVVEAEAEPLDGLAVAAIMAADPSTAGLPVLILAECEDQSLRRRAVEAGAAGVLVQPEPATLTGFVARRVRGREQQPAPSLISD